MRHIICYRSKIIAEFMLVKPLKSAVALLTTAACELPYDGTNEMLLVDDVDDKKFLF